MSMVTRHTNSLCVTGLGSLAQFLACIFIALLLHFPGRVRESE